MPQKERPRYAQVCGPIRDLLALPSTKVLSFCGPLQTSRRRRAALLCSSSWIAMGTRWDAIPPPMKT